MKPFVLLFSALLIAQTAITPDQQRAPVAAAYRIIAVSPDGKYQQVEVGVGIEIVGGKVVVTAAAKVPQSARLAPVFGTYAVPSWMETITRNGLLMEAGEDYTVATGVLTPINGPWAASDKIVARGSMAPPAALRVLP